MRRRKKALFSERMENAFCGTLTLYQPVFEGGRDLKERNATGKCFS